MANMNSQMIELYHDLGKMPDWAYYQQNDKTALDNYKEQKEEILENFFGSEDYSEIHITSEVKIKR